MDKFMLKPEYIDCQIITRTEDGTEILVTKETFNDYYGELMFKNGQHNLIMVSPHYKEDSAQKKTFEQITENVIILTSNPVQNEESEQKITVNELESMPKRGRRPIQKV